MLTAFPRDITLRLIAPIVISVTPWVITLGAFVFHSDSESAIWLSGAIGIVSFFVTGPLTGLVLSRSVRDGMMKFPAFAALLFLVGLPSMSFQVVSYSASLLSAFMIAPSVEKPTAFLIEGSFLAVAFYLIYAVVGYWRSNSTLGSVLTAVVLFSASVGALALSFSLKLH
ncbi:MAG TPA: hypothetical protein VFE16_05465 [Candidatus Cybelea sp.]|nr:hypothetical protein [Candidatus Cybelea sp.]